MSLLDSLKSDLVLAMKARDKLALSVLRMVKAALVNEEIRKRRGLSDEENIATLKMLVNQRKEAAQAFRDGGIEDSALSEEAEIIIIQRYLPQQMSESDICALVQNVIEEIDAQSPSDFGAVMKTVMTKSGGRADGNTVKQIVNRLLSE